MLCLCPSGVRAESGRNVRYPSIPTHALSCRLAIQSSPYVVQNRIRRATRRQEIQNARSILPAHFGVHFLFLMTVTKPNLNTSLDHACMRACLHSGILKPERRRKQVMKRGQARGNPRKPCQFCGFVRSAVQIRHTACVQLPVQGDNFT